MTDYQKYINALRKCAKEHENDRTSTGHVIVSDLCRDTANLLEQLSGSEEPNKSETKIDCDNADCNNCVNHKYCDYESTTKNGISNRTIIYKAKESIEIQEDLNKLSELNKPTTKNDLPHCQCTDAEIAKSFIEDVEAVKDQLPCGEQMDFPNTFDEFVNDYGFKDKQEVYTNGSELIPVFRVKQWLEHINSSTTKNDLGVDWESYKDVDGNSLDDLILEVLQNNFDCGNTYGYKVADEIIGLLPSVTPQEPKTGHWIDSSNGWMCSECERDNTYDTNFCPNCGCRMVEPQESEE